MKKLVAVPFLIVVFSMAAAAQSPFFQNYFLLKKNEPVCVNTVFQDKSGFIWYGTTKGLFRFDGVSFARFMVSDSAAGNVTALAEDSIGRIWIGQKNGVMGFLEKDKWEKWNNPLGTTQPISKILFDHRGVLWFSTLSDGLYYYSNRLYRVDEMNGMPDLFVYDIAEDAKGRIWAGTDGGVAICSLGDTVSVSVINYQHGLPDNIIKKIHVEPDGKVWMVTDNSGLITYDPVTGKSTLISPGGWHFGAIADFLLVEDQLWIAASPGGIIVHDRPTGRNKIYNDAAFPGLTSINALLKDQEGNIWIGSRTGVLRTMGNHIEYIETAATGAASITAVAVERNGSIWWAGEKGLFRRTVSPTGTIQVDRQLGHTAYEKYTITSLYFDTEGYLWIGFYGEGALRINPANGSLHPIRKELRNGNVLNISGKGKTVWMATLEGAAAFDFSGDTFSVRNYGSKEGLSSDYIYQVFVDSQNRVWFATDGKGADMMDEKGFHHFDKRLHSKVVYGFAEDSNHVLWANVAGEGLFYLEEGQFKTPDPAKSLRDNAVSCLASDAGGNLVVMHDLGIDLYEVKRNKIRFLGDEVGIREKFPNLNAAARDESGRIYFGTSGGIVIYTDLGAQMNSEPIARIEGIKVLDKSMPLSSAIELPYDKNYVTINYLGLWYQNPENLFFQTKLENYERDWINSRGRSVTYSSLPPGEYIFHLRVSNTADFTTAGEILLRITVAPPFWQRAWFVALLSVLLLLIAGSILTYRERSLKEDKRLLEMRVTERTLEIQRKTEEIQAQNEEIQSQGEEIRGINENLELLVKERTLELIKKNKALEEYAFITAHNLRAPVASVLGLINLAGKLDLDEESKVIISHMQTSAEKLDTIVRSITEAIEKAE